MMSSHIIMSRRRITRIAAWGEPTKSFTFVRGDQADYCTVVGTTVLTMEESISS